MTGAVIVVGLVLLVVGAFSWARISAAWNDRRSIDSYGHALGVLGDVARRTESSGNVRIVSREGAGGGHVKTEGADAGLPAPRSPGADRSSATGPSSLRSAEHQVALELQSPTSSAALELQSAASPAAGPPPAALGQLTVLPERRASILDPGRPAGFGNDPDAAIPRPVHAMPRVSIPVPARPLRFEDDTVEWTRPDEPAGGIFPKAGRAFTDVSPVTDLAVMREARTRPAPYEPAPYEPEPYEAAWYDSEAMAAMPPGSGGRAISVDELGRQATLRRVATGAVAGVAVLLAFVAVLQLTGGSRHTPAAHTPKTPVAPRAGGHSTSGTLPAVGSSGTAAGNPSDSAGANGDVPSGPPRKLVPISTTPTDVSFIVPSRRYLLTFSDGGAGDCWVGVSAAVGSTWLWTEVLQPGTTTSFKATGPTVVDLGAPSNIALKVNGITARLPVSASSYDVSFSRKTSSASTKSTSG